MLFTSRPVDANTSNIQANTVHLVITAGLLGCHRSTYVPRGACSTEDTASEGSTSVEYSASIDSDSTDLESSDDGSGTARTFRWHQSLRKIMVASMLKTLTFEERDELMKENGSWPNAPQRFTKAYKKLRKRLIAKMEDESGKKLTDSERPSPRAVKEAAKRWTRRFLLHGHIQDDPPHKKGYKLERNRVPLQAIKDMIMRGWVAGDSADGEDPPRRLFRDLHHLHRVKGKEFEDHFNQLGLKTKRGLWSQLKEMFPKLAKVAIHLKKQRPAGAVRVCSITTMT